jgi:hypothetical protein
VYAPWKKRADLLLLQGVAAELREALLRFGRAQASLAAVELPVRLFDTEAFNLLAAYALDHLRVPLPSCCLWRALGEAGYSGLCWSFTLISAMACQSSAWVFVAASGSPVTAPLWPVPRQHLCQFDRSLFFLGELLNTPTGREQAWV